MSLLKEMIHSKIQEKLDESNYAQILQRQSRPAGKNSPSYDGDGVKYHTPDHKYNKETHATSIGGAMNGDEGNLTHEQAEKITNHLHSHGISAAHTSKRHYVYTTKRQKRTSHVVDIYDKDHEKIAKALNSSKEHVDYHGGKISANQLNGHVDSHNKKNHLDNS